MSEVRDYVVQILGKGASMSEHPVRAYTAEDAITQARLQICDKLTWYDPIGSGALGECHPQVYSVRPAGEPR